MTALDEEVSKALGALEASVRSDVEEPGWFALGLSLFGGRLGWVVWIVMAVHVVLLAFGIYAGWRCYAAVEALPAVKWGVATVVSMLLAFMFRLSMMPLMASERVLRRLARVEALLLATRR